jgi:hypothetical protein
MGIFNCILLTDVLIVIIISFSTYSSVMAFKALFSYYL